MVTWHFVVPKIAEEVDCNSPKIGSAAISAAVITLRLNSAYVVRTIVAITINISDTVYAFHNP